MGPVITNEPWALHVGEPATIGSQAGNAIQISGVGQPRLLLPAECRHPYHGARRVGLPPASFPFVWGGDEFQAYELPLDHHLGAHRHPFATNLGWEGGSAELIQTEVAGRGAIGAESEGSLRISAWIDWQVHCFQELIQDEACSSVIDEKNGGAGLTRRSWDAARSIWVKTGQDDAQMAMIVRLARQRDLHQTLESISRHPRRVLERVRQTIRLDRIEQLDSACIRDYARRPGITTAEKAGPRQELLAVKRRENRNTLENRVTCWVLDAVDALGSEYNSANRRHFQSPKCRDVRRFRGTAATWRQSEELAEVRSHHLDHPIQPNYPLQFDPRYRVIYETYRKILHEQKVVDDAWQWQRVLWGETGRQVLACALTKSFRQNFLSAMYVRNENSSGRWTEPPLSPGPLETSLGECVVIDCWEATENPPWRDSAWFPGAKYVGSTGCDQVLWWPRQRRALLVWHHYWTGEETQLKDSLARCSNSVQYLANDLARYERVRLSLHGLVLVPEFDRPSITTVTSPSGQNGTVTALKLPADLHRCANELMTDLAAIITRN